MSKMAEKTGGQSRQASGSKAEAAGGKSVGRSHENVAFTLAAGSIGLAVTLLEQERAEAATNLTHEASHDQAASDSSAAAEGASSSGDNLLITSATASDSPQGAGRVAISEAAGTQAKVAAPVNIEAAGNVTAADHEEAPAASEASQTLSQAHTAMSSSDISQGVAVHQSAGSGTISVPAGVTPVTPHSPVASHQNDPVDWSAPVEHVAETVPPDTAVNDGALAPVAELISDVGGTVGDVVSGVGDLVGDLLGGSDGKGLLSDVGSTVGDVVGAVGDVVSGVGDLVGGLLGSGDGKGLLSGLGSVVENAMDTVGNLVSGVGSAVGDVVDTVSNVVSGVGSAVEDVGDTVGGVVSGVGDLLGGLLGGKDGPVDVRSTVENVMETVGDAASSVGSVVGGALDTVGDAVSGVGSMVDGVLDAVGGAVSGVGGGLLGDLASTEQDSQETAATTAANMFDAVSGALQFSDELFGILTPTLSFLGQSMFVPNDPLDLSNHHGTMLHGLTWEG